MIKVSSANFFVGNKQPAKDARFLAGFDCDINGIQEGHSGNARAIRESLQATHRTWWRKAKNNDRQLAFLDVPVSYPKKLKVLKRWARQISKRSQVKNIGMPRAVTAVRFEKNGETYTFLNTHTNAAVQSRRTDKPLSGIRRVTEFIAGMVILEAMIVAAKRRGDHVVLVGDLNYRVVKKGIWKFSPQAMFKRQKMDFHAHGVDYISWSKGLVSRNFKVVSKKQTGADHSWLITELHERR